MQNSEYPYWRSRLDVPSYKIGEAARYAELSSGTVAKWHQLVDGHSALLSSREGGSSLSYLQLIEVAIVAAFRKAGVKLSKIRAARQYVVKELGVKYPFAEYNFKTDGVRLLMNYDQITGETNSGKFLELNDNGQLAWHEMLSQTFLNFDYEDHGQVVRWYLRGKRADIFVDPRICFGQPNVGGIPTWIIASRIRAGEPASEIADDYDLATGQIIEAWMLENGSRVDRGAA